MRNLPSQNYFKNKRVLIRVDFNVEQSKGKVFDDFRIRRTLPTIKYLQKTCSKLILASHMTDEKESLAPTAKHLSKLLKKRVYFIQENIVSAKKLIDSLPQKSTVLLENLRFDKGEKENSLAFGKNLANLADVFVQDAFGEVHRKVASIVQVPKFLPSFAGFLLMNEIKRLDKLKTKPAKPLVLIIGGAKLKTKLPLIKNFVKKARATPEASAGRADYILLGGGVANTGLLSLGLKLGKSLVEPKQAKQIKHYTQLKSVFLPIDFSVAKSKTSKSAKLFSSSIDKNSYVLDIGPETIKQYQEIIKSAKTIIWNGPMGYYENPVFAKGTKAIAKAIFANKKAFKIIGGGETVAFLNASRFKLHAPRLFISTGGGAMLEFLAGLSGRSLGRSAGKKLPGIVALEKSRKR